MFDKRIKQSIVYEYLEDGSSYRQIGEKYGVRYKTVNPWVLAHENAANDQTLEVKLANLPLMKEDKPSEEQSSSLVAQVKELQKQLEQEKLHNRLLTARIDIAEKK